MTRSRAALLLAGLVAAVALMRLHTYHEPLDRDLTSYAVIAHELLQGRELYSDLWDHKPPAIHVTYALGELLAGYGRSGVYCINVLGAALTLLGAYAAGGMWAAAYFAVVSGDLALQANQPNVELFLNAALVWSYALLKRSRPMSAGSLLGLAVLYKPNALPAVLLLILAAPLGSARARLKALAVAAALPIGTVLYFASTGRAEALFSAVLEYNAAYGGGLLKNLARGLAPWNLLPRCIWMALPLAAAALCGARERGWLAAAYAAGTYIAVAAPGRFYPHYYQLWLPPLALGAAATLAEHRPRARWALLGLLVALQAPWYRLDAETWSRRKYGPFNVEAERVAAALPSMLGEGEQVWSGESGVYFASQRRPASGIVYDLPLREGPLVEDLTRRLASEWERRPPRVVVLLDRPPLDPALPLARALGADYQRQPADPRFPSYALWRRKRPTSP